jgi:hypothetical protein
MQDAIEPPTVAPAAFAAVLAMPLSWLRVVFESTGFALLLLSASARAVWAVRAASDSFTLTSHAHDEVGRGSVHRRHRSGGRRA